MIKFIISPAFTIDYLITKYVTFFMRKNVKTLDVGCGKGLISKEFSDYSLYTGVDIEDRLNEEIRSAISYCLYDGLMLPFSDGSFDQIISMEVLEHVENIDLTLSEIYRVLKPGGSVIVSVPFIWNEHEIPFDFRRYTKNGLELHMLRAGFSCVKSVKIGGAPLLTLMCIDQRNSLSKLLGKKIAYSLMIPIVILCNVLAFRRVKDCSQLYSNVVFLGEKIN